MLLSARRPYFNTNNNIKHCKLIKCDGQSKDSSNFSEVLTHGFPALFFIFYLTAFDRTKDCTINLEAASSSDTSVFIRRTTWHQGNTD